MPQAQQDLAALAVAADYGVTYRDRSLPLHPTASTADLRAAFRVPLPDGPRDGAAVIGDLIAAAEPGLVGCTEGDFYAWVIGGSSPVGVAADWLTSVWGQNAAIHQTAPAAAIAEEAVADWLLDLLDLPREASVGFTTGATMAAFTGLAAARTAVLARAGHDFERLGLQGAPLVRVFASDEVHVTNRAALRHLGFGEANLLPVASDDQGRMRIDALAIAMEAYDGPKIVVAQAGQINTGAFEDFRAIAALARTHGAWVHVDGAFGLWARALPEKAALTKGLDMADSWSVDGHKWMQVPYDSGFAIVRDRDAHRRAMDITASYLVESPADGRNPTHFAPELSRRARGFAAWAVFQSLGRAGVRSMVARHCRAASVLAARIADVPGLDVLNEVVLNQVVIGAERGAPGEMAALARALDAEGIFARPASWRGAEVLRFSFIAPGTTEAHAARLSDAVAEAWPRMRRN